MALKQFAAYLLAGLLALTPALAQEAGKSQPQQQKAEAGQTYALPDASTTEHSIGEGSARIEYKATAGALPLANDKGETAAKVFYVAYSTGDAGRPVSFVFNGGPGAASAFLHIGAMGPRVLEFTEDGSAPRTPVELRDNPDSWLSFTDLVFVDPVGTGYSRATGGEDEAEKAYYGVERDAHAMADFVRLYLTRAGRDLAPVYLVGESYGGFRAAHLANLLLQRGAQVKGAILISPALEFSMIRGDQYALVPLALDLPAITASHIEMKNGLEAPLDLVEEAEAFAQSDYLLHLVRGLNADRATIDKLARFTGIAPDVIARHHGRVDTALFRSEQKRLNDRAVSVYDGAVTAPLPRPSGHTDLDPILDTAVAALTPVMTRYTQEELGFKTDAPYRLLNRDLNKRWDYGTNPNRQGFAGSLDELQKARALSPGLKVFIAHGYTDLVTPYTVSRFLIAQLRPIESARPIDFRVYRGGHMMYMRAASRRALAKDAKAVYDEPARR